MGLRNYDLGFLVSGSGLRGRIEAHGSEFMVYDLWFMVYGLWFMVYGLWLRAHGSGFRRHRLRAMCSVQVSRRAFREVAITTCS